jgi:hypothetical protein
MELVSHSIPAKVGQEILLMPVGDIQWSGRDNEVAMNMLRRHIEWGVERGAWFLGMGDYIDFMSPSNRARYEAAGLYDTTRKSVDDKAAALAEDLFEKALKPSRGRWLGLLEGHHYHTYRNGITSDQDLAERLDAPFLGACAFVRLMLSLGSNSNKRGSVVVWCHHGVGGGVTLGAPLNKLERLLTSWEADIYLIGHHHKKVAGPIDRIEPAWRGNRREATVVHRTKIIACTGSFLKGYATEDGAASKVRRTTKGLEGTPAEVRRGGYVEQKMLNPVALGGILVKIKPRWTNTADGSGWMPDLNVEL